MIDVSDGLLQDLGHLGEESHVGAVVEALRLPLSVAYRALLGDQDWSVALTGGEDYELLFSAAVEHRAAVGALAQTGGCAVTRIGRIVPQAEGLSVRGPDGATYMPAHAGHDHFRQA
jgi:thiamine-monophosphate kinase